MKKENYFILNGQNCIFGLPISHFIKEIDYSTFTVSFIRINKLHLTKTIWKGSVFKQHISLFSRDFHSCYFFRIYCKNWPVSMLRQRESGKCVLSFSLRNITLYNERTHGKSKIKMLLYYRLECTHAFVTVLLVQLKV